MAERRDETGRFKNTRREFIQLMVVAAGVVGTGGLLDACSPGSPPPSGGGAPPPPAAPAATTAPAGAAQAKPTAAPAPIKSGGSLVIAVTAEPVTLDAPQTRTFAESKVHTSVYDGLLALKPDAYESVPGLAERWDISSDGLAYTFYLRKGIKFHDGTPFNAEAVKFHFDRTLNKEHPLYNVGTYPSLGSRIGNITATEVVDDSTVRIKVKEPFGPFLDYLATWASSIVSPTAVQKYGKEIGSNPVGTGPFRFEKWDKNQRVVLKRNPDYWGEKAKLDEVVFIFIPEAQARLAALRTGTADLIEDIPPDSVAALKSDANVNLIGAESPHVWYMVMNQKFEPFQKNQVRQAVKYSINREAIVRDVLQSTGVVARGPLSSVFGTYVAQDLKAYNFDPARAKQLLAEGGFPNGFSVRLDIAGAGPGMQAPVQMATVIQSNLAQAGIKVEIKTYEWGDYSNKVRVPGDFQFAAFPWTPGIGNPDIFLFRAFHSSTWPPNGNNEGFYKNEELDRVLAEARRSSDRQKQIQLYQQAQRIIQEEGHMVFVDHQIAYVAASKKVQGFKLNPSGNLYLQSVSLSG